VIHLLSQDTASNTLALLPALLLGVGLVWFVVCAVVLFVVDLQQHRLPNRWTGLLFGGAAIFLLASTLTAPEESALSGRWLPTIIGSLSYLTVMFVLHILTRAGIGMGDVKLAAGLGLYTGFIGVEALVAGFVLAFLFGGVQAIFLMMFRGAKRSTRIAFGPAMLVGCAAALLM
jgi:leader peptidase (prepilin peptidase)/N-methyltransferase